MKAAKIGLLALVIIFAAGLTHGAINKNYIRKAHELANMAVKNGNTDFIKYYEHTAIYNADTYRAALAVYNKTACK